MVTSLIVPLDRLSLVSRVRIICFFVMISDDLRLTVKGMVTRKIATKSLATEWVDQYGDSLFRYALSRLRNREIAEDLVQETFLAALQSYERFQGQSSVLTWLTGILRHKVVDHQRRSLREQEMSDIVSDEDFDRLFFDARGHWKRRLGRWPDIGPEELEREEFWQVFRECLAGLTPGIGDAFRLREVESQSTTDICGALQISPSNLSVRLHRARTFLRRCLELHWFQT